MLAACGTAHVASVLLASPVAVARPPLPEMINGAFLAQHLPRIQYQGGPFLRYPRIVTVTFAGDSTQFASRLEQFGNSITRTNWWRAVVAGYCVNERDCIGDGQPGTAVRLSDVLPAQIRAVDISALLKGAARAGHLGTLDANSLLLVYLPPGVNLSDAFARYCGNGPHGFHRALRFDGKSVPYAVIPRCDDEAATTATASHELLEATTNPDNPKRGFAFLQSATNLGFTAAGVEPVDACGLIARDAPRTSDSGFVVQRAWSNRAASIGGNPCVPVAAERPYVALVPSAGVIPLTKPGEQANVSLVAASDRPVQAWRVTAIDLWASQGGEPCVALALDQAVVVPGQSVQLSITRLVPRTQRLCMVGIVSSLDGYSTMWPLAVGQ